MTFEEIKKRRDDFVESSVGVTEPLSAAELRDDIDELIAEHERQRNARPKPGQFEYVLPALRRGEKVRRKCWPIGCLRVHDGCIVADDGPLIGVGWASPETDVLADDWEVMPDDPERTASVPSP